VARPPVLFVERLNSWPLRYEYTITFWLLVITKLVQIILGKHYGSAVDWWAFGVLTYEMLLGQSPFHGDDEDEIFDAIVEDEPLYPITMPRDAVSIIQMVRASILILSTWLQTYNNIVVKPRPATSTGRR